MNLSDANEIRNMLLNEAETNLPFSNKEFLPMSKCINLINEFPVLKMMQVSKDKVHNALVEIFTRYRMRKTETTLCLPQTFLTQGLKRTICVNCENKILITDTKQGDLVCTNCGACMKKVLNDDLPKFNQEEPKHSKPAGEEFPQWMMMQTSFGPDKIHEGQISTEIDHWAHYYPLTAEDFGTVKGLALSIKERVSNTARIAAGFLFLYISKSYNLDRLDEYSSLEYKSLKALFECSTCREQLYSAFDKRRHKCFSLSDRKQWSLVKNKKTKIISK